MDGWHNRAADIAPVVVEYWRKSGGTQPYEFYGSDRAVAWACESLRTMGFKKRFFQSGQDFVVSTLLSYIEVYTALANGYVQLYQCTPEGREFNWLGNGAQGWPLDARVQFFGSSQPLLIVIQLNITPIYSQLQPFLEHTTPD